jgi:hypothetical protein
MEQYDPITEQLAANEDAADAARAGHSACRDLANAAGRRDHAFADAADRLGDAFRRLAVSFDRLADAARDLHLGDVARNVQRGAEFGQLGREYIVDLLGPGADDVPRPGYVSDVLDEADPPDGPEPSNRFDDRGRRFRGDLVGSDFHLGYDYPRSPTDGPDPDDPDSGYIQSTDALNRASPGPDAACNVASPDAAPRRYHLVEGSDHVLAEYGGDHPDDPKWIKYPTAADCPACNPDAGDQRAPAPDPLPGQDVPFDPLGTTPGRITFENPPDAIAENGDRE